MILFFYAAQSKDKFYFYKNILHFSKYTRHSAQNAIRRFFHDN